MFRALLAHLQEVLHKQQMVYCVHGMSVGCCQDWSGSPILLAANRHTPMLAAANQHNMHTIYQLLFVQLLLKVSM
jgi:hypothetical protein